MDRAFYLPKLSLRPCLAIAIILFLPLFISNSALAAVTGSLKLTDASWQEKTIYRSGETLYIQVSDADENKSSTVKDTLSVSVVSATETTGETVTLTETDINTGIFRGSIALDDKGSVGSDGKLQVTSRDNITVTYKDLTDEWRNTITITKTASFLAYPVTISTDTTWTLDNSPYIFTTDVIVDKSVTLTIEPGVIVKFTAHRDDSEGGSDSSLSELIVYGGLKAYGTPAQRIKFSSSADSPAPGDWGGIIIGFIYYYSPLNIMEYCDIKYAQIGISGRGAVDINNCKISDSNTGVDFEHMSNVASLVKNSIISGNIGDGLRVGLYQNAESGLNSSISIEGNFIVNNGGRGILLREPSHMAKSVNIVYNAIIDNGGAGIDVGGAIARTDDGFNVRNNYISRNGIGIYFSDDHNWPALGGINYNSIVKNKGLGILALYGPPRSGSFKVHYNNLYENGSYDFYIYTTSSGDVDYDAKYNYWGTKATEEINAGGNPKNISTIYDYFDDNGKGMVNYSQWLDNLILLSPTGIIATPADTAIDLSWIGSEGTAGYYLYYGLSPGSYNPPINVGNKTSYRLNGLSNNTTYYIALTAYDNQRNESTYSYELELTTTSSLINSEPNTPIRPSPTDGATNQPINTTFSWTGGDFDAGDTVTYDIYGGVSTDLTRLASDLTTTSYSPGTLDYSTSYYWQIVAKDNHGATSTGPVWSFTTGPAPNNPPNIPTNPSPANGATGVAITQTLSWSGGDPDTKDTITYDIYFGTSATPSLVKSRHDTTTYNPGTLNYSTTYYWKIVATDSQSTTASGPVWSFTTGSVPNNPPNTPSNPSPADGATGIPVSVSLSWSGSDPDGGDTVTYDLYFGTSSTPSLVKSNLTEASYSPGTLAYSTKYYWRVVARDNHGAEAGGSVWNFQTGPAPNNPPYTPSNPSPANDATVASISLRLSWSGGDPDTGDSVAYDVYWDGAGNNPDPPLWASNQRDTTVDVSPLQNPSTVYYWKVVAKDSHGATSTSPIWEFTTATTLTNPPNTPAGLRATITGKAVHIQWQANSESNLDHYNLYLGTSSKGYNLSGSPFNVGKATSLTASDVPEGTYYLALSAVNASGLESSLSEEIKVVVGAKPSITISTNKSSYSPGDTLTLSFALSNPTATTQIVDVFLGIVAPDGSIYFFDSSPFLPKLVPARADDSRTFTPASTSLQLSPGDDFPLTSFFSMTLPSGLPEGT